MCRLTYEKDNKISKFSIMVTASFFAHHCVYKFFRMLELKKLCITKNGCYHRNRRDWFSLISTL